MRYSIKDLENYTSIKAHTLRIWEQRYGLLEPKRTDSNIRYYSEDDLKKILNVNLLYTNGLKISKIAKLSEDEILEHVRELIDERAEKDQPEIHPFMLAITEMDPDQIHDLLNKNYAEKGMVELYNSLLIPVLMRIGELWQVNTLSIAHEHLFSNVLRAFLIVRISKLDKPKEGSKNAILFLPGHEEHELSLLFYHYILKSSGVNCIYLGAKVPLDDLKSSVVSMKPDVVISNLIAKMDEKEVIAMFKEMEEFIPLKKVRIGGAQALYYKNVIPKDISFIRNEEDLIRDLK